MPFVVYVFTLSAFALGLAEFVPIGLTQSVAHGLGVSAHQSGLVTTFYALGAAISAPVLSAVTAGWPRKRAMLATVFLFSLGSLAAALAPNLAVLVGARLVAGVGHGLFLAVASDTAAQLAGPQKAGRAIAAVFGGFTLAMAVGVPLSTWLGQVLSWRLALGLIAVFGVVGLAGLAWGMPDAAASPSRPAAAVSVQLRAMFHPVLLMAALVTVLGYAGSFTVFTYIALLLTQVTGLNAGAVSLFMLAFGVSAVIGNAFGGRFTDWLGVDRASGAVIAAIAVLALGIWMFASSSLAMAVLVALLGMVTFGSVPALQARLLSIADRHAPGARGVASGLNIAGFNAGIAAGSFLGAITLGWLDVTATGLAGAVVSLLGWLLLWGSTRVLLARAKPIMAG
ncbi:MAG: MFS transporter [Proteobacteria bacterium]|nr:MFS transporter [Pseudomonadota bacterium]